MSELISINELLKDDRIRRVEHEGKSYFSLIDVFSVLLNTDRKQAQNYYHVFKKRLRDSRLDFSLIRRFKAQAIDKKSYLTDFTTLEGIEFFYSQTHMNIDKKRFRSEESKSDEIINFHPKVEAFLRENGWQTQHHVRLLSGSVIDLVASLEDKKYVVECKPELSKAKLYTAIGQVLCYRQEYDIQALPMIVTCASELHNYNINCCEALGITLIGL